MSTKKSCKAKMFGILVTSVKIHSVHPPETGFLLQGKNTLVPYCDCGKSEHNDRGGLPPERTL